MKLAAIVRFWRLRTPDGNVFSTDELCVDRVYTKLPKLPETVKAAYRNDDRFDEGGQVVALILEPSQADIDFGVPILFLTREQVREILRSMDESDEVTYRLRGRGWRGKHSYTPLHELMV